MSDTDRSNRGRRRRWLWFIALLFLGWVGWVTRDQTLPLVGGWLDVGESPERVDYVMLLHGDVYTRPFTVADLLVRDLADRAIITSVADPERLLQPNSHEQARTILHRCGVEDERIVFLDTRVGTTFDEAKTLDEFIAKHPGASFSVVTNTFHTRRTRWIFRRVLGERMSRVQILSSPTDFYDATNWWKNEDGFERYLAEFLKSLFYFYRYGNGILWTAAILGLLGLGWWIRRRRRSPSLVA